MSKNVSPSLTRPSSEYSTNESPSKTSETRDNYRGGRGQGRYIPPALRQRMEEEKKSSSNDFPSMKEVRDALPPSPSRGSSDREPSREHDSPRGGYGRDSPRGGYDRNYDRESSRGGYDRGYDRSSSRGGYDRDSSRDSSRGSYDRDSSRGYDRDSSRDSSRGGYDRHYDRDAPRGGYDRNYDREPSRPDDRDRGEYDRSDSGRSDYPSRGGDRDLPRNNDRWKRDDSPPSEYADQRGGGGRYDREERNGNNYHDRQERSYQRSPYSDRGHGGGYHRGGYAGSRPRWEREEPNPFEDQPEETGVLNFDSYDEIPVETSGNHCPQPLQSFTDMPLAARLKVNIQLAHYNRPTPVQKYAIPVALDARDLMGCAQTGSGKTAAFLFPIISQLIDNPPETRYDGSALSRRKAHPACLVLAPTRELATQIFEEARKFCYKTGIRAVVCYGGSPIAAQLREIEQGCHILVATPGRLVDILERGRASLSHIQFLVLDEADRMLDMGFEPQIRRIVEKEDMPFTGRRRTFMFSATFPREIQLLASQFLEDYIFLRVGRVGSTTELVTQKFLQVNEDDKRECLIDLLSSVEGLTLIFVETKRAADSLEHYLCGQGFPAISIHGDRTQTEREMALAAFKAGERPFLIATNVASRGLDIRGVVHVMNYDMPSDIDEYVHRIGRTGRAGATGLATSFISEANKNIVRDLVDLLAETKQEIPGWLIQMTGYNSRGHRGGSRGGTPDRRFGGRDYRQPPPVATPPRRNESSPRGGGSSHYTPPASRPSYTSSDTSSSWWKD